MTMVRAILSRADYPGRSSVSCQTCQFISKVSDEVCMRSWVATNLVNLCEDREHKIAEATLSSQTFRGSRVESGYSASYL